MRRALARTTAELTIQLLAASVLLIGASLLGAGAALPVALSFVAVSVALLLARDWAPEVGRVAGHDVDRYLADLWLGAGAAALTTLLLLGASPGELQAAGGMLGLAAMLNYFLRPFYAMALDIVDWVRGLARRN